MIANTAIFTAYATECFGVSVGITNSCRTAQTGLSVCAQSCLARYTVQPNPAKDYLTIEFDNVDNVDALPDEIALVSETSTKPVKTVNVQETFSQKIFKNGNQIEIDVKDLPVVRTTYTSRIAVEKIKNWMPFAFCWSSRLAASISCLSTRC